MKTTRAFFAAMLAAAVFTSGAAYAGVQSWSEQVMLDAAGGAEVSVAITADAPGAGLPVPCSLPNPASAFLLEGTRKVPAAIENRGGVNFIKLPALKTGAAVTLGYTAAGVFDPAQAAARDFGNIEVKYAFVNNTGGKIERFEASLALPPGMSVNTLTEYQPKPKKGEAGEPYRLSKTGGRRAISIVAAQMKLGDRAALRFDMKREKRPLAALIILLLAAVWYLFSFHDILLPHAEQKDQKQEVQKQ